MPLARKLQVDDDFTTAYHCISRCVRKAHLCGEQDESRREWVRELITEASGAFAIDTLAYAVMSNHLHLVLRTMPDRVSEWSDTEVIERWARAHPRTRSDGTAIPWSAIDMTARLADAAWIATARLRLRSLSWFMKCVKERLARRANRADKCTGHFWEVRFKSIALLNQAAVIACMVYVDLNPIRATIADRPETSDFTSVQERIRARDARLRETAILEQTDTATLVPSLRVHATETEGSLWIAPIASGTVRA